MKLSETQKHVEEAIHSNDGVNEADQFQIGTNNNVENIVNDAR